MADPQKRYRKMAAPRISAIQLTMAQTFERFGEAPLGGKQKRVFDCFVATIALPIALLIMVFVAVLIKSTSSGPIIYTHSRVGFDGRRFACFKFRTMISGAEIVLKGLLESDSDSRSEWTRYQKLARDPRITRVGHLLRRSSLDELPQLINVIRGDMSLVGPRPITRAELSRYGDKTGLYLSARPGLTGLWQISGRSDCDFQTRVALDADYVSNWCFLGDLVILVRTIIAVLKGNGSY